MGITFKIPYWVSSGADKNAEAIDGFGAMGFGFIEVGTVTLLAQEGNAKPRQFRLVEAEGLLTVTDSIIMVLIMRLRMLKGKI